MSKHTIEFHDAFDESTVEIEADSAEALKEEIVTTLEAQTQTSSELYRIGCDLLKSLKSCATLIGELAPTHPVAKLFQEAGLRDVLAVIERAKGVL